MLEKGVLGSAWCYKCVEEEQSEKETKDFRKCDEKDICSDHTQKRRKTRTREERVKSFHLGWSVWLSLERT